jgi:hypothetical protein
MALDQYGRRIPESGGEGVGEGNTGGGGPGGILERGGKALGRTIPWLRDKFGNILQGNEVSKLRGIGVKGYQTRGKSLDEILALAREQAMGGRSFAQEQAKQNLQAALAQQRALAASARPGQGGLAARLASQQSGQLTQDISGQAIAERIKEQNLAAQNYLQAQLDARGQELEAAGTGAKVSSNNERLLRLIARGAAAVATSGGSEAARAARGQNPLDN